MHAIFWILQIILAVKFASVAYTHALHPDQAKMERGMQRLGAAARPLLACIALCSLLGALALILPAATGVMTWLTTWAAALLALFMLAAIGFHVVCRENPKVAVGLILAGLAALVAYGRWAIAPL